MTDTCSQGFTSRMSLNGQAYEFTKIVDHTVVELTDQTNNGIRGILDHPKERVAPGRLFPAFDVYMDPSATDLKTLLLLMSFTESTGTFTISDAYPTFTAVLDKVKKVHTFTGCVIGQTVFSGQRGGSPLSVMFKVFASGFSEGTSFGSPTVMTADYVFAFMDGVMTLQAATRQFDRFKLLLDPHMEVQWNNSQTPSRICPTNREIILQTSVPYVESTTELFTTPLGSSAGAAGTLVCTRGTNVLTASFANLKSIARPPSILNKGQIRLPLTYKAFMSGATAALGITLVYP